MSETGSTKFPEPPRLSAAAFKNAPESATALNVRIIRDDTGQSGSGVNKILRIKGEVTSADPNGRVSIRTPSGSIEVEIPPQADGKTIPVKPGQRVDIEIPVGRDQPRNEPQAAQIRIRETRDIPPPPTQDAVKAPPPESGAPVTIAPRPDLYTPPAKAPDIQTTSEIIHNLQHRPVRLDPLLSHYAPPTSSVTNGEAISLLAQLAAVIPALPQNIVINAESAPILLPTPDSSTATPLQQLVITVDQLNRPPLLLSQNYSAPLQIQSILAEAMAPPLNGTLTNTLPQTLQQPSDIRANFKFLSPETIKISSLTVQNTAPLLQIAPIAQPFIATFEGLKPPPVILNAPQSVVAADMALVDAAPETLNQKPLILSNADIFAKPEAILQQGLPSNIVAVVQGFTANNLPVIAFPDESGMSAQNFILQAPLGNIASGSIIELNPSPPLQNGMQVSLPSAGVTQHALPAMPLMPEKWPLMEEIMRSLNAALAASPSSAGLPSGAMIPSPSSPAQMGAVAMFVIAAMRAGDLSQILSERSIDLLRSAGKGGLAGRLTQEGNALSRTASEPLPNDWRALTLPMMWENDINKVVLYYKNDQGTESEDGTAKGKHTRFIFDLDLSRMGKVQLDGLFRDNRMDMIVRTREPFSRPMQIHIQNGYGEALQLSGLNGDISFQNDPSSFISIKANSKGLFQQV